MSERTDADKLAERLLEESDADPETRVLARQLLRRRGVIERLEKELTRLQDPHGDLVNANRDTILRIHDDELARISKIVRRCEERDAAGRLLATNAIGAADCALIRRIINAAMEFHPMHGESWSGYPEGT